MTVREIEVFSPGMIMPTGGWTQSHGLQNRAPVSSGFGVKLYLMITWPMFCTSRYSVDGVAYLTCRGVPVRRGWVGECVRACAT